MKKILSVFFAIISLSAIVSAHLPIKTLVQIVKAEDELRFDKTLEDLMKSPDAHIRTRAALASGRIGNEAAIPALVNLLEKDKDTDVQAMAAFALGEIESIKSADAILTILKDTKINESIRARAIEAAGKIAAANPKDEKAKLLGEAILQVLIFEDTKRSGPYEKVIEYGLTAVLRARPAEAEKTVIAFTNAYTPQIRANALNTLTRLRAKNANEIARNLLQTDADAVVRANAARVLGAAEDKDAFEILLKAATTDKDSRVRVAAIRSLGSLKNANAADKLIIRGNTLLSEFKKTKNLKFENKSEMLEIAAALGRILPNTENENAIDYIFKLDQADIDDAPEVNIALAQIAPVYMVDWLVIHLEDIFSDEWRETSAIFQGVSELAKLESNTENDKLKSEVRILLVRLIGEWFSLPNSEKEKTQAKLAIPDLLRAFAAFKSENTSGILLPMLETEEDLFIRAAIAEILGDQPVSKENVPPKENIAALKIAFAKSLKTDKDYNDAQLAILSTLVKLNKSQAISSLNLALDAPDFLVRQHAATLIKQNDLTKDFPNFESKVGFVKPYNAKTGTKLGQILNTNADYTRAVSRKNGTVKAIFETEKGSFTINLMPEDAPLTVDNFIKLAQKNYFNGLEVHRVVPNFVMQDGDPRGDGNGGPGWSIRCEINMLEFERGAVGMALSGKDTGGSQWFVTHSPQPHLDGGYTVFGRVNETDMKVVDAIVRGDKIIRVKIETR